MLSIKVWMWSLASFSVTSFVLCVIYGLVTPESLHMHTFLETVLPGFRWLTVGSFFIGLLESLAYGAYAGIVFVPIHNFFYRRWGLPGAASR